MRKKLSTVFVVAVVLAACSDTDLSGSSTPATTLAATTTAAPASTSSSPATPPNTTVPGAPTTDAEVVGIPALRPAVIDGVLEPGEWDGAVTHPMSDGASVWLMYSDETLNVAVEGDEIGAVNVVLATEEAIWILHSSAALGSALYEPGSEQWELTRGFSWCCRDRNGVSGRLALLDEEGWQANIGFTGDAGIVEYQIAIPWRGASIAVSSTRGDDDTGFWPADLSDEARLQLLGSPPPTQQFDTHEWPIVTALGN